MALINIFNLFFRIRIPQAFVGMFAFFAGILLFHSSWAQTVPPTSEPQRLDKRFQKPSFPGSEVEPKVPSGKNYVPPEELKKIQFIL